MVLSLLEQILAAPADDQVRLVHADALLAAGDARGELITVEIELARAPTAELRRRRSELRRKHAVRWWPELDERRLRTRRGFVESVVASAEELAKAAALSKREPVSEIELVEAELRIPDAWRPRLRRLIVQADGEAEELLALLRACPKLEALAVHNVYLAAHPVPLDGLVPVCKHLDFAGQHLYGGAATYLDWKHIGQLESLDLSATKIDAPTLELILARRPLRLRVLRLSGNRLGDGARWVFSKHLRGLPALRRLEIADNGISDEDLGIIGRMRPDVEVVGTYRRPERFAIEVDAMTVEFVARPNERWSVELDGRPIDIRVTRTEMNDLNSRTAPAVVGREADLEPLVHALVIGESRALSNRRPLHERAFHIVTVALSASLGHAYNTSVYTTETARISIPDPRSAIHIELERYVSID